MADERWGGRMSCVRCGHPAGYHGTTFCMVEAGAESKRRCDCTGWVAATQPSPEPLDVERLARALDAVEEDGWPGTTASVAWAAAIAAEYARLAAEKENQ